MSDKMREAFEKWYMTNTFAHVDHLSVFYNDLNCYSTPIANQCWKAWQAAQSVSVPVAGEPTDAAYKWMIANGVEPMTSLHKLGERLAALLDEDQFSECEALLLTAITAINTFVPVPAAELVTLREKAARIEQVEKERDEANARLHDVSVACATAEQEREELRKALLALKEDCQTSNDCQYGTLSTSHVARIVDAAIAQGKGE